MFIYVKRFEFHKDYPYIHYILPHFHATSFVYEIIIFCITCNFVYFTFCATRSSVINAYT